MKKEMNLNKGLDGMVVLDLSSLLPGPYCTSLLLSMGAEVWKIERPGSGDLSRNMLESFACLNWGKRSTTLDLSRPEGKEVFRKMAEQADVIVESSRPGVVSRLGIDYKAIREVNPKIVYCSISGYGQDGPCSQMPAHDVNIQALCSSLSTQINEEIPDPILPLGDLTAGIFATVGILNALLKRQGTGEGSYLDISMADGPLTWVALSQLVRVRTDSPFAKHGLDVLDRATPHYGTFKTGDGKLIALGIVHEDHLWKNLCRAMDQPQWADMDHRARVRAGQEMRAELRRLFRQKDRDEWLRLLEPADIPVTPVNSFEEAIQHPQFVHRQVVRFTEVDGTSVPLVRNPVLPPNVTIEGDGPPGLGEHTFELLQRLGYNREEMERLQSLRIV